MVFGVVPCTNGNRRPRESGFMFMIRLFIVAVHFRVRFPWFWLKFSLLVTLSGENNEVILLLEFVVGKNVLLCIMYFLPDPVSTLALQI